MSCMSLQSIEKKIDYYFKCVSTENNIIHEPFDDGLYWLTDNDKQLEILEEEY